MTGILLNGSEVEFLAHLEAEAAREAAEDAMFGCDNPRCDGTRNHAGRCFKVDWERTHYF